MKKIKKIFVTLFIAIIILTSCSGGGAKKQEMVSFTDDIGRSVEIPSNITKIIPSGGVAQTIIFSLAPDKMMGLSSEWSEEQEKYVDSKYLDLPVFGQFYGKNVSMNKEEIIAADADIIIDFGQVKKSMEEDLNKLQEELGIPVIFLEATLETTASAYEKLGQVLGMEKEAKPFVNYINETIAMTETAKKEIKKPVRVYYGEQENGLQTSPQGSMHAEVLDLVGAENVVESTFGEGKSSGDASLEQVVNWNPDYFIFGPEVDVNKIQNDDVWKTIPAINDRKILRVISEPLHWLGRPPGVNRFIGVRWIGYSLYPEQYDLDMVQEMRDFYKLFYHYDLSEEDARTLLYVTTV